jgi:hypothetical protein
MQQNNKNSIRNFKGNLYSLSALCEEPFVYFVVKKSFTVIKNNI